MTQTTIERLHIVEGSDWKDAVIALLEPAGPYRPWRYGFGEAHAGDAVAVVLNTDPVSVLTETAHIGDDGDPGCAVIDMPYSGAGLVELATLAMMIDVNCAVRSWKIEGDAAVKMRLALSDCRFGTEPESRFGHTSLAAARTLLYSEGTCDGCNNHIDLSGPDARDQVYVHTVDPHRRPDPAPAIVPRTGSPLDPPVLRYVPPLRFRVPDWPAVLCRGCRDRMANSGFRRVLDFKFDQHPACPLCGLRRSLEMFYGMPSDVGNLPPWVHTAGCCVSDERWYCSACDHKW